MKHTGTTLLRIAAVAALALALGATTASAIALRNPQVPVATTSLQDYLNGVGESIDVLTDQTVAENWQSTVSGNSTFTLMLKLAGNATHDNLGIYNSNDPSPTPVLFQLFPSTANPGWFAVASFRAGGVLVVNLFDQTASLVSSTTYNGVNGQDFGFYLQGPGGLFFTEDHRNDGGNPQAITFMGTDRNAGSWWVCFEDLNYVATDRDFNDAVMFLESVNPTPVLQQSWGGLKARYR